jgi:XTP/dITP diphosphohydrolase
LILAATSNKGKIREIRQILSGFDVLSLQDIGFQGDIVENGKTFLENAAIKAMAVYDGFHPQYPDAYILADDSGLEVEALDGRPGVLSARYAGEHATQSQMIEKLLKEMKIIQPPKRTARFFCQMVLVAPDKSVSAAEGTCCGRISELPSGTNGFGYDPVFLVEEFQFKCTMADLPEDRKNEISHRRKALNGIKEILDPLTGAGK